MERWPRRPTGCLLSAESPVGVSLQDLRSMLATVIQKAFYLDFFHQQPAHVGQSQN